MSTAYNAFKINGNVFCIVLIKVMNGKIDG